MHHSLTSICKYKIGIAALFLAAKTEEVPIRMDRILIQAHKLLYKNEVDIKQEVGLKLFRNEF